LVCLFSSTTTTHPPREFYLPSSRHSIPHCSTLAVHREFSLFEPPNFLSNSPNCFPSRPLSSRSLPFPFLSSFFFLFPLPHSTRPPARTLAHAITRNHTQSHANTHKPSHKAAPHTRTVLQLWTPTKHHHDPSSSPLAPSSSYSPSSSPPPLSLSSRPLLLSRRPQH